VDKDSSSDGIAYLRAEKVIGRMERIRESIGADYLFCVTALPLRDEDTSALYYYSGGKISILSIWSLDPPLEGPLFKKSLANYMAITLLEDLSGVSAGEEKENDPLHPIHTNGYFNTERSVDHIAGRMKITKETRDELKKAIKAGAFTAEQFKAIKALLSL
jgi:hypothetical protein